MERFGQYILLDKVGSGGMAELFKAKKLGIAGFERVLAIKRILPHLSSDDEFIEMFIDEAKLVARLNHKNIVQVYDFGKMGQNYFIAMEYVRGKDLRAILKHCRDKKVKLPVALSMFIAKEVASGLSYAHKQKDGAGKNLNIIHRDVSPQNILISYDGDVKVVDFGIAKAGAHSKTTTGVLKGKLSYMSPEQAWGRPIDHRSDIFSLGVVLYEMLTGAKLFRGDSEISTLEMVRGAKVEPLPSVIVTDLPSELEARMLKALAKEVKERYQDVSEMEADMGDIMFKILSVDPASSLKQFMHDLFKSEIEAEQKAEIEEETVRVPFQEESAEEIKVVKGEARAPKEKTTPQKRREPGILVKKRKKYPFVIAALFVVLAVAAFMFWPKRADISSYLEGRLPLKEWIPSADKTQTSSSSLDIAVTMKDGNVLYWSSYFEDGSNYCTRKSTGLFCIPKSDVISIKSSKEDSITAQANAGPAASQPETPKTAGHKMSAPKEEQQAKKSVQEDIEGVLIINAVPWANVYIDGRPYGTTPKTIENLMAGAYKVKLENPNFPSWEKKVNISNGQTATISHKFGGFGKLVINASPWGNVYLDGELKGQTPLTIERVTAGKHQVKVVREGFTEFSKAFEIGENATEQLSVSLKKEGE